MLKRKGFTLIELLVVVLIIGILAAIALPQYEAAVKKSKLAKYMAWVSSIARAQDAYYLAAGKYSDDLNLLDVSLPFPEDCVRYKSSAGDYYKCNNGNDVYGMFDGFSNVQAGEGGVIRYLHFIQDYAGSVYSYKKGEIYCYANGYAAVKACQSLGGTEIPSAGAWEKRFKLN